MRTENRYSVHAAEKKAVGGRSPKDERGHEPL